MVHEAHKFHDHCYDCGGIIFLQQPELNICGTNMATEGSQGVTLIVSYSLNGEMARTYVGQIDPHKVHEM